MRLCKEWQIYADDMTVCTGKVVDGNVYTDAEYAARVSEAFQKQKFKLQQIEDAFKALGFNPAGMEKEKPSRKKGSKTDEEADVMVLVLTGERIKRLFSINITLRYNICSGYYDRR